MAKTELLAPAGSFEIGKTALYSGADALYLAAAKFGARAYAKNLSLEEIKDITNIAHVLGKKIYVTLNTIVKDQELAEIFALVDDLYLANVDGLILTDLAVLDYVLTNCPGLEAHISTQVGVKDLNDALYFEDLGAKRVVLARETSLDEIRKIKKQAKIELEVFIHGALCVSYSGGCLMSSLLTGRSGNRGRCAQNCRREYKIFEGDKEIAPKGYYLSMKDLNSSKAINELMALGVDSLKIEGRMKQESYVAIITKHYRKLMNGFEGMDKLVDKIFHRKFTTGFLQNTDRALVVDYDSPSNEGKKLGEVIKVVGKVITMRLNKEVQIGDKIRFEGERSEYLTITNLKDKNKKKVTKGLGVLETTADFVLKEPGLIYASTDLKIDKDLIKTNLIGIDAYACGSEGEKLSVTFICNDKYYVKESKSVLTLAKNKAIDTETLEAQLQKLTDTPFYLASFENYLSEPLFLSLSEINEIRRELVKDIYNDYHQKRSAVIAKPLEALEAVEISEPEIICKCHTYEQYEACKEMGIKTIFYDNVSPYVNAKYQDIKNKEVLVSNYGGLRYYKSHLITTDFSFNIINHLSCYHLLKENVKHITLSLEMSKEEIKNLALNFQKEFNFKAPLDLVIYGHQRLMTLKYCPLKHLGLCGKCEKNLYSLKDEMGTFYLTHEGNCVTDVLNGLATNNLDEMNFFKNYVSRFRLDFTIEDKAQTKKIIAEALSILAGSKEKSFTNGNTHAYLKRSIF